MPALETQVPSGQHESPDGQDVVSKQVPALQVRLLQPIAAPHFVPSGALGCAQTPAWHSSSVQELLSDAHVAPSVLRVQFPVSVRSLPAQTPALHV
jgi:hypothetical protein